MKKESSRYEKYSIWNNLLDEITSKLDLEGEEGAVGKNSEFEVKKQN